VEVVYKGNAKQYGNAGLLARWALCDVEKLNTPRGKQWLGWLPDAPFTLVEFDAFLMQYSERNIEWPSSPEKWNKQAYAFRHDSRRAQYMRRAMEKHTPQTEIKPSAYEVAMEAANSVVSGEAAA
jgi:hypothetical protein